jgi:hypothetical protein
MVRRSKAVDVDGDFLKASLAEAALGRTRRA